MPVDIPALDAVVRDATPGPWRADDDNEYSAYICGADEYATLFRPGVHNANADCDARAIVALRNAWPAVSAELRRLRAIADLADVLLVPERERRSGWPETTAKLVTLLRERREANRG